MTRTGMEQVDTFLTIPHSVYFKLMYYRSLNADSNGRFQKIARAGSFAS